MKISLPDGAWADLYEPEKVPERKRRPLDKAMQALLRDSVSLRELQGIDVNELTPEQRDGLVEVTASTNLIESSAALNDALVLAMVREWSFGEVTLDALLDLPMDAYRALGKECAPFFADLMPDFSVSPDPKAAIES